MDIDELDETTEVDMLDHIHDRLQELDTTLAALTDIAKALGRIADVAESARWLLGALTWGTALLCILGTVDLLRWLSKVLQ